MHAHDVRKPCEDRSVHPTLTDLWGPTHWNASPEVHAAVFEIWRDGMHHAMQKDAQ